MTLETEHWFVVAAAAGTGEAEIAEPLMVGEKLTLEASGLTLYWKKETDDEECFELVVVDRYQKEISITDPDAWDCHPLHSWQQICVEDSDGNEWTIIMADSHSAAEGVQAVQNGSSEVWLDGIPMNSGDGVEDEDD